MAPVYEGKRRPPAGPLARGPHSFVLPAAPRRAAPGPQPRRPAPAPHPRASPARTPPLHPLPCPENGRDPEFHRILFPRWRGRGCEGGLLPEEKKLGGGAPGKDGSPDSAFYLFVIDKGDGCRFHPPHPPKITFRMISFPLGPRSSLSICLHSHPRSFILREPRVRGPVGSEGAGLGEEKGVVVGGKSGSDPGRTMK